jgi:hypothetical protein
VLFPRSGCEQLLGQIFELGVESRDDLYYGLVWLLCGLVSHGLELPENTLDRNLSTGLRRFQIGGFEPHEAR